MAGGIVETDPAKLAAHCENFRNGVERLYQHGPMKDDMWLFELYHHLTDCAAALSRIPQETESPHD